MAGAVPVYQEGPVTYEVNAVVVGGQLVIPDGTTGKVKPSTLTAATVLGVATKDAVPVGTDQNSTVPNSLTAYNVSPISQYVAVASDGVWMLKASAALAFGVTVKAAANGQVAAWVSGTDAADTIVGRVVEPGGISSGATGQVLLQLG